jgi:hypothetical protein
MTALPDEAVKAAAGVIARAFANGFYAYEDLARRVLEVAAPALAAGCLKSTAAGESADVTGAAAGDPREPYGRLVRTIWEAAARELIANPKPSWLTPWKELNGFQKEVDMRIGHGVAAAERVRIRQLAERTIASCPGGASPSCCLAELIRGPGDG